MRVDLAELNACPPLLNQKQLRRVCHISPRTAHYLLQSGAIPNERGSQYRIRREDVLAFMQSPEKLLVPAPVRTSVGKWGKPHTVRLLPPEAAPESTLRAYYIRMFADLPDVLTSDQRCHRLQCPHRGAVAAPGSDALYHAGQCLPRPQTLGYRLPLFRSA